MRCVACGTDNPTASRFCDQCGAPLSSTCPSCGETNRGDALFCASCGTAFATGARTSDSQPTPAATPTAERRQVSVLFADLVGFTDFAEGRDPEQVRAFQDRYFTAASEAIERHGGTVEKFIGDAVMAVWGTPVAHEDDAQRAVRAGLEVVDAVRALGHDLDARAGVVTAEAAVSVGAANQGMVAGDMVNTASRLQSAAGPGQVLADQGTVQAAASAIGFEPIDDLTLKGKAAPVRAWRATHIQGARAADLVQPPFVGRVEELRRLKELLHATGRDRRLRFVSIIGPAGIGKTRLVEELGSYATGITDDIYWHVGRAPSYGEGLAFWALGEMVRRRTGLAEGDDEATTRKSVAATVANYVADPDERSWIEGALLPLLGIGESASSESLFPAWRTFFERIAERGTVLLVFEDLQWADSGTFEFIEHLLDWSRNQPILLIGLARPELADQRPGWGTTRSSSTSMALEPMPETDMRELLSGMLPGLPEPQIATIVGRAEGMPLYAVEMVRALLSEGRIERRGDAFAPVGELDELPIPTTLRSLIASRLDALDADDRALLQQASVLGLAFEPDALASVSGRSTAEVEPRLRALVRREFLEIEADPRSPERGQYRFVQSLIREVAYDTLAMRERRARHLAAARHLEASATDEVAGALASHYLAAFHASDEGPEADAVAAQARVSLRAAADRAVSLGAHAQAVTNLEHALSITTDPRERADLLTRAATSAAAAALPTAAEYAREAVELCGAIDDREATLRAIALHADVLIDASRVTEAAAVVEAAAGTLGDIASWGEPEAAIKATEARAHMRMEASEMAIAAADQALVVAERLGLARLAASAMINKGSALSMMGHAMEGAALLEGGIQLAEGEGLTHLELRARHNLASTVSDNEPLRALEVAKAGLASARRVGDIQQVRGFVTLIGDFGFPTGRRDEWSAILELIAEAEALSDTGVERLSLLYNRTFAAAARGEVVEDELARLERYVEESGDPRAATWAVDARARAHFAAGRHAEAAAAARKVVEIDQWAAIYLGPLLATSSVLAGDVASARWARDMQAKAPGFGAWSRSLRSRADAIVAAGEGRVDDAIASFTESMADSRRIGLVLDAAFCALDAVLLLPDEPRARAFAPDARAVFDGIGAMALVAQLDAALTHSVEAPSSAPAASAASPAVADGSA